MTAPLSLILFRNRWPTLQGPCRLWYTLPMIPPRLLASLNGKAVTNFPSPLMLQRTGTFWPPAPWSCRSTRRCIRQRKNLRQTTRCSVRLDLLLPPGKRTVWTVLSRATRRQARRKRRGSTLGTIEEQSLTVRPTRPRTARRPTAPPIRQTVVQLLRLPESLRTPTFVKARCVCLYPLKTVILLLSTTPRPRQGRPKKAIDTTVLLTVNPNDSSSPPKLQRRMIGVAMIRFPSAIPLELLTLLNAPIPTLLQWKGKRATRLQTALTFNERSVLISPGFIRGNLLIGLQTLNRPPLLVLTCLFFPPRE